MPLQHPRAGVAPFAVVPRVRLYAQIDGLHGVLAVLSVVKIGVKEGEHTAFRLFVKFLQRVIVAARYPCDQPIKLLLLHFLAVL